VNINLDNLKVIFGVNEVGASHFLLNNFISNYSFKEKIIFAEKKSHEFLKKNNINFYDANLEKELFINLIKKFKPDLIVTGASIGLNIEKKLIKISYKYSIKSFSFIDANINLWQRFIIDDPLKKWSILPSAIIVDDFLIKERLINLDCPVKIFKIKKEVNVNKIFFLNQHEKIDYKYNDKYILLIHETGIQKSTKWKWDNDEELVNFHMNTLIKSLINKINNANKNNHRFKLIIKSHPSDENNILKDKIYKNNFKDFIFINKFDSYYYIKNALIVIGIGSKLLYSAGLVNKNTYSLKLNDSSNYPFTGNSSNIKILSSKYKLNALLEKILNKV
tara:strand:+ start:2902 stop:3903 length:1002 start_codon:yes stop_codon:yes gene_type:complete